MKIAVMGAGAVGCYYGFRLARAGNDVVLIGRPQHERRAILFFCTKRPLLLKVCHPKQRPTARAV